MFSRMMLVAVVGLSLLAGCGSGAESGKQADQLRGAQVAPEPDVSGISLPDVSAGATPLSMRAEPGTVRLVFFGFASCPDVCPTTLSEIRQARKELGGLSDKVSVAMVTVDTERDTDTILTDYVRTFVPDGHALRTTDPAQLTAAANAFGASYQLATAADGSPEVGHSNSIYVVDDRGKIPVQWLFGVKSADIAHDVRLLLKSD